MEIRDILSYLDHLDLEYSFEGNEFDTVNRFSSLSNYKAGSFTWIKTQNNIPENADLEGIQLVFTSYDVIGSFKNVIRSHTSKQAFFSTIEHFFADNEERPEIGHFTYIGKNVKLGKGVRIGHNCTLDGDIVIGDNTQIWNNVTIVNRVRIGSNCEIQSGTVIGQDGFGYAEDENHVKTMIKHFGGVHIEDDVFLGSNVCVVRGTIDDTHICKGVKVDNMCHVAHNCYLGENVAMAFPCRLGGSSRLEKNAYVAAGTIRNQCSVGENGFVGMGSIVTKSVPAGQVVVGNPAREFVKKK